MTSNLRLPLLAPEPGYELRYHHPQALTATVLARLQAHGMRWTLPAGLSRAGGAGPSDHKAIQFQGQTVMVPIFTATAKTSPFEAVEREGRVHLYSENQDLGPLTFPPVPAFYQLKTKDGIPYHQLATLHASKVLATTVLQTCTRYGNRETACQFCAIGESLSGHRTVAQKSPTQLAEVAEAAMRLDGVEQMVLTTGTPKTPDRGAAVLSEVARAVRTRVDIPIQAQCEPPKDQAWFRTLKDCGVSTLGMHLEAVNESVRQRIMPGKAEVAVSTYLEAFEGALEIFGWGEVTTYILAGLGDTADEIVEMADTLSRMGVYPFVVPFVPIVGTPLASHPPPRPEWMESLLDRVAAVLRKNGLSSDDASAGCGKCGACSTLKSRELTESHGADRSNMGMEVRRAG